MKKITATELKSILANHKLWIDTNGKQGNFANLRGAYLSGAYLSGADLAGANLRGADLVGADLTGAYLRDAYLTRADLTHADLTGAYLRGADLYRADLRGADLRGADLTSADLTGASLILANLEGADLLDAILTDAKIDGAILTGAILTGTILEKNGETKMNMENENGFILSSEEKDMVLEYRKKTAKDKKINEIKQTATALRDSFRAIEQVAGGGTYCLEVGLQTNTKLLQEVLSLFGTVNQKLHSVHFCDGRLQKQTLSFAMPSLD